jgi:hydrogenase expression/formation protein HypD
MMKLIKNIRLLTALKTMPQAIRYVTEENDLIDGFIAPGHVCVVTGSDEYKKLAEETGKPFCISGFEPEEILVSIYALVKMQGRAEMKNLYPSVVTEEGNLTAQNCVKTYFEPGKAAWRGLGLLEDSGLYLKKEYSAFDAGSRALTEDRKKNPLCRCGDILKGAARPCDCPMFGTKCTPQEPQGACMVSYEGACAQAYEG